MYIYLAGVRTREAAGEAVVFVRAAVVVGVVDRLAAAGVGEPAAAPARGVAAVAAGREAAPVAVLFFLRPAVVAAGGSGEDEAAGDFAGFVGLALPERADGLAPPPTTRAPVTVVRGAAVVGVGVVPAAVAGEAFGRERDGEAARRVAVLGVARLEAIEALAGAAVTAVERFVAGELAATEPDRAGVRRAVAGVDGDAATVVDFLAGTGDEGEALVLRRAVRAGVTAPVRRLEVFGDTLRLPFGVCSGVVRTAVGDEVPSDAPPIIPAARLLARRR